MIRRGALEDLDAIASLNAELGYPAAAGQIRRRLEGVLAAPLQALLVYEAVGRVAAWIHVAAVDNLESDRFAEIRGLIVAAEHRSRGIGAELVAAAETWARDHGMTKMRVRSNVSRDRARRFYERLGYAVTKTQNVFDRPLTSSTD